MDAPFTTDESEVRPVTWLSIGFTGLAIAVAIAFWDGRVRSGAMWVSIPSWIACLVGFTKMPTMPRWLSVGTLAIALGHWWALGTVWGLALRDAPDLERLSWIAGVTAVQAFLLLATAVVAGNRGARGTVWAGSAWLAFLIATMVR